MTLSDVIPSRSPVSDTQHSYNLPHHLRTQNHSSTAASQPSQSRTWALLLSDIHPLALHYASGFLPHGSVLSMQTAEAIPAAAMIDDDVQQGQGGGGGRG